jgi:thiosulfate/3-mercaptopyruvate sulfurtransferase
MSFTTLIDAAELQRLLQGANSPVLLDCSFDLADTASGRRAYVAGHLPGAHYLHLDDDLSSRRVAEGPRSPRFTGRHPLPDRQTLAVRIGGLGIGPDTQVVAYDGQGSVYASRAWWLLRWLGHEAVAVLDGGTAAWLAAGGTLSGDAVSVPGGAPYPAGERPAMPTVDAATLQAALGRVRVLDARAGERFRGEVEPLDPVAGHIPGATHRFFKDNLAADGRFKPAAQLREDFLALGASGGPGVVHQCGSGVTACHNLLAMEHAGLAGSALYAGSWSEWCADPARPVARG